MHINTNATAQRSLRTNMCLPKARCADHALGTVQPARNWQDCALRFGARRIFSMANAVAVARKYAGLARARKKTQAGFGNASREAAAFLVTTPCVVAATFQLRFLLWPFFASAGQGSRPHGIVAKYLQNTPSGKQIFRHRDSNPGRSGEGRVS